MWRRVRSTIGCKQLVHKRWVVLPLVNLLLECMKFTPLQIKFQQTTCQQMEQNLSFRDVHFHGRTQRTCGSHIESMSIFTDPKAISCKPLEVSIGKTKVTGGIGETTGTCGAGVGRTKMTTFFGEGPRDWIGVTPMWWGGNPWWTPLPVLWCALHDECSDCCSLPKFYREGRGACFLSILSSQVFQCATLNVTMWTIFT